MNLTLSSFARFAALGSLAIGMTYSSDSRAAGFQLNVPLPGGGSISGGGGNGGGFGEICNGDGACISGSGGSDGHGGGSGQICGPGGCISGGGGNGGGFGSICDSENNCISGGGGSTPGGGGSGFIGTGGGGMAGGAVAVGGPGELPGACKGLRGGMVPVAQFDVEATYLIDNYYRSILGRHPESLEAVFSHIAPFACGNALLFSSAFVYSREHLTQFVTAEYAHLLDRAPDPGGLDFWVNALARGMHTSDLDKGFVTSPEFVNKYPGRVAYVNALYQKLLNRQGEPSGVAGWSNPAFSIQQIADGFIQSSEARQKHTIAAYRRYLQREPDPGGLNYWASKVDQGSFTRLNLIQAFVSTPEFVNRATSETALTFGAVATPVPEVRRQANVHTAAKKARRHRR